jgi:hypothetical protein
MNFDHSKEEVLTKLEKLIKGSSGRIAPQDAAAATGYSTTEVEDSLARLMELYKCKVEVDEVNGRPIFNFDLPFKKRGEKTFQEKLASFLNLFWEIFKKVYKVAIGVILIVYTVIFVLVIMIAASQGGDRDRRSGSNNMISGIFSAIFNAMQFAAINQAYSRAYDQDNMSYRYYERPEHKGKKFIQSIFDFVFGPERPKYDPLNDTKEVAEFIRSKSSKLTSADIINLSGVSYNEADSRLAEYAAKFRGDIYINEAGTAIADFKDLSVVSSNLEGGKVEYYIDEVEQPYELTGNTSGRNFAIGFMNLFNLMMSIGFAQSSFVQGGSVALSIALGWFPLVFSILFFLIPIGRAITIKRKQSQRSKNVVRKILVGQIISADGGPLAMEDIVSKINLQNHPVQEVEAVLSKVVTDLNGEIAIDENGTPNYSFERLKRELRA